MSQRTGVKRSVRSLRSILTSYVVNNFQIYSEILPQLKKLPWNIKDNLIRQFLIRGKLPGGVVFNEVFDALIHPFLKYAELIAYDIDDNTLNILSTCHKLVDINLANAGNHSISSNALQNLFRSTKALQFLDISDCSEFNDEVLKCLADNCKEIRGIYADGCNIGDEGFIYLADKNSNLMYMTISRTQVSGNGISAAIKDDNLSNLKEFRIDDCADVTVDVIKNIADKCSNLEIFTFYNCDIEDHTAALEAIAENCKNLKNVHWSIIW